MLTVKDIKPSKHLSVYIAVAFAEEVLHFFEEKHPKDLRPREAIEAAKRYLDVPSDAAANAAASAAYAASAYATTYAAYAAYATAYASNAANAANAAADAAYAASCAASYAASANAAYTNKEEYTHERIKKLLPYILQYKIDNKEPFGNPEKVLEYLSEDEQQTALFHLDILV